MVKWLTPVAIVLAAIIITLGFRRESHVEGRQLVVYDRLTGRADICITPVSVSEFECPLQ